MSVHHHRFWILSLVVEMVLAMSLLSGAGLGQATPAAPPPAASAGTADTAKVGPDAPVVTMDGFCGTDPNLQPKKAPCRTVLTRSEFEKLADALGAGSTTATKAQFATFYVEFSQFAREAQKRGMDKDPVFQTRLELARLQLMGQVLLQDLQEKSKQFAPGDLEKFFGENPAQFEQATLVRVFIPWTKFKDLPNGVQQPISESAPEMKLVAQSVHTRARAGADFEALQKEVVDTSNLREGAPPTKLEKMSRGRLRRSQQVVLDLKLGEVSALFEEPDEGYYIYKILSREMPPFESVKSDVMPVLEKYRMDTWKKDITQPVKVSLNEQYFGAAGVANSSQTH
jgi:hypothetical protein